MKSKKSPQDLVTIKTKNIPNPLNPDQIKCKKCNNVPTMVPVSAADSIVAVACQCGSRVTFNATWDFDANVMPLIASKFYHEEEVEVVYKMVDENGTKVKGFNSFGAGLRTVPMSPEELAEYYNKPVAPLQEEELEDLWP